MIKWTIWTPMSSVLKKADKLNLSLSLMGSPHIAVVAWFPWSYMLWSGSRPDSKTWRFFYFGDLWPEGLLASLTYINGPSGDRQIWKVLHWKSDKYFKMNTRTIQLNGPIQYKILFYTSGPDFVTISTTFMWYFRKNRAALGEHCIPCQDGVQKSDFVT